MRCCALALLGESFNALLECRTEQCALVRVTVKFTESLERVTVGRVDEVC